MKYMRECLNLLGSALSVKNKPKLTKLGDEKKAERRKFDSDDSTDDSSSK